MKTLLTAIVATITYVQLAHGQSDVIFANNVASAVTNSLTGQRPPVDPIFAIALYVAPDGTTNEAALVEIARTIFASPGRFNAGSVYYALGIVSPGGYGIFQVRIWETNYGNTYDAAIAAGPQNGRTSLRGKSILMRIQTGTVTTPGPSLSQYLNPIVLTAELMPTFTVNNILVAEGTNGTKEAVFTVRLQPATTNVTTIDFMTVDGTAFAGSDFIATNGTLTFAAGQTTGTVSVTVTADPNPEPDERFFVQISNPTGGSGVGPNLGSCTITEVRVTGISVDAAVTFNTIVGHHYTVEKSDNAVNWSGVTGAESVTGSGAITTVIDHGAGCQAMRLYRARLLD
jgi:hypothetical protein